MGKNALNFLWILLVGCQIVSPKTTFEEKEDFMVVGYVMVPHDRLIDVDTLELEGLTDINLAFINPDPRGNFPQREELSILVESLKEKGLRVYFSLGGNYAPAHLKTLMHKANREVFLEQVMNYALRHGFDGLDLSLGHDLIDENFDPFLRTAHKKFQAHGLRITAALSAWSSNKISDKTLSLLDCIYIMSFEKTGPWNPLGFGQHAPMEMVKEDYDYFHNKRNIPSHKLLIGMPLYGRAFGPWTKQSWGYSKIMERFPEAAHQDRIQLPEGGVLYFNSPKTLMEKVNYSKRIGAAGVMLWSLQDDAKGEDSFLRAINDLEKSEPYLVNIF